MVNKECCYRFIERQEENLVKDLCSKIPQNKLHPIRKRIKQIVYLADINSKVTSNLKSYNELENIIGSWHDKQIALKIIRDSKVKAKASFIAKIKTSSSIDLAKIMVLSKNIKSL